jgi:hypothetical protein
LYLKFAYRANPASGKLLSVVVHGFHKVGFWGVFGRSLPASTSGVGRVACRAMFFITGIRIETTPTLIKLWIF